MTVGAALEWKPITVGDEPFEWALGQAAFAESSNGEMTPFRERPCMFLRRAGAPGLPVLVEWTEAAPPEESDAVRYVELNPERFRPKDDAPRAARQFTSKLQPDWMKLPLPERVELSRMWIERLERIVGKPGSITDPSDLRGISVTAQLAAHTRSVAAGDEERAAQERDVRAALERMSK